MSFKLIRCEQPVPLDENLLHEVAALPAIPGEREKKKVRMKFLKTLVAQRNFNRCEWATCYCKEDKKTYRVNGQHSTAILSDVLQEKSDDLPFPAGVPVTIQRYECDKLDDLAEVFDMFDNPHSSRKPEDKLGVYMAQHADLRGINKKICSVVLTGIHWGIRKVPRIKEECEGHSIPDDAFDRGLLLSIESIREFIDFMHQHQNAPFGEWMQKSGIVAEMYEQFLLDRETAELAIEQTLWEAGDPVQEFTHKIRQACARTGNDQGYYYRQAVKHFKKVLSVIEANGRDAIKQMIREVMAEGDAQDEAA